MIQFQTITRRQEWNEWLAKGDNPTLWQAWEYGEGVRAFQGILPVRELVILDGRPVAVVQTLLRQMGRILKVARVKNGPVFFDGGAGLEADQIAAALKALRRHWVDDAGRLLYLAPALPSELVEKMDLTGFEPNRDEEAWDSLRVDLSLPLAELRRRLKPEWRTKLRKAEKSGLVVETPPPETGVPEFIEEYAGMAVRRNFFWPPIGLVRAMWETAEDPSAFVCLTIRQGDKKIARGLRLGIGNTLLGFLIWSDPEARAFQAGNLLDWSSIVLAKESGFRWFDIGGAVPDKSPGVYRFKLGMGGEYFKYSDPLLALPKSLIVRAGRRGIVLRRQLLETIDRATVVWRRMRK